MAYLARRHPDMLLPPELVANAVDEDQRLRRIRQLSGADHGNALAWLPGGGRPPAQGGFPGALVRIAPANRQQLGRRAAGCCAHGAINGRC